jgi:hypothetical protein
MKLVEQLRQFKDENILGSGCNSINLPHENWAFQNL